jgi:peptide/nickel transport system substrate-binding protein
VSEYQTRLLDQLVRLRDEGRVSRRQFMRLTSGGVGLAAISAVIASCGSEPGASSGSTATTGSDAGPTKTTETFSGGSTGLSTATAAATAEAAASPTAASAGLPKPGGKLTSALDTNPTGMDPHVGADFAAQMVWEHMYDPLFEFKPDLTIEPGLCTDFEVVDDLTYKFTLREGVLFHDGRPFTADDVKFSIERAANADIGSIRAAWFTPLDGIEVVDDQTCVFHLKTPFAPLMSYLAMPASGILDKAVADQYGDFKAHGNGTGPFQLEAFESGQFAKLKKFADHWREGIPYLADHEIRIATDEQSRVAAIRAKEHDFSRMFDPQNAWALEKEGFKLFKGLTASRPLTILNCRREPFNDKRVRQALSWAIDRKAMMDTTIFGDGVLSGYVPVADVTWGVPVDQFEPYSGPNIDKAKALLAEAGHPDGFECTMKVSPQYAFDISNAQIMQQQLAQIGVTMKIEQLEWGNLLDSYRKSHDFDLLNIILTYQPDPDGYLFDSFHTDGGTNSSGLSDPEVDDLLLKGRTTADHDERVKIYRDLQLKLENDLCPVLTTFEYHQYWPSQQYVMDYKTMPSISRIYMRDIWLNK